MGEESSTVEEEGEGKEGGEEEFQRKIQRKVSHTNQIKTGPDPA